MENAVPLSVFWGLNFPRNLLLSFNKHTAHSLSTLKAFWESVSSGKVKQGNSFYLICKRHTDLCKGQNETVNAYSYPVCSGASGGQYSNNPSTSRTWLLFVRKIGSNADIKKTNQDGTLFQTKGQIEAGTSASLKERRVCCIHWDKVGRCEVVSESNMQKSRNKLDQMETPGSEGQLAFIIMPSC